MRLLFCGLLTLDVGQLGDELPAPGRKGTAQAAYMDVGGPAANAAIAASMLGGEVVLTTVVGSGDLADYCRAVLEQHNVALDDRAPRSTVPVASIWIDAGSGERTIFATNNADVVLDVGRSLDLDGVGAVLLDGHYPELALTMAAGAARAGIPIVLDCGRWRPVFADLLPLASDVIMTATFRPPDIPDAGLEEIVAAIRKRWELALVAATQGAADIVVARESGMERVPVPVVDVVDTTGAGDVFHGTYVFYRYARGMEVPDALTAAGEVAAQSCTHLGVRGG